MCSGRRTVDPREPDGNQIGARETQFWAEALRRAEESRARTKVPAIDVEFNEFLADQIGTVRRIYDHFGLILSHDAETRMHTWLARNPRRSTSLQRVAPEEFGLTAERLKATFAHYRALRGYA